MAALILFDDECGLCRRAVAFVSRRDRTSHFRFAPLQSPLPEELLAGAGLDPATLDSIVLIDEDRVHTQSDAALRIARGLQRPWSWLAALLALPAPLRDAVYRVVARNRHRLCGPDSSCRGPAAGSVVPGD